MIADRGVAACPYDCIKSPAKRRNRRAVPAHPDHPRAETAWQRSDRTDSPPQETVQPLDQIGRHEVELLGPDGRRAGHRRGPPRARPSGSAWAATTVARRRPPRRAAPRPAAVCGASRSASADDRLADRPRLRGASCRERRRRSSATAPAPTAQAHDAGRAGARDVREVRRRDHALARGRRCARRARSRRSASSSLMTSSSSSSGGAPRSSASASRSASSSASSASRCSPCEP